MFIEPSSVLASDSAEHWLMVQAFRADMDGAHPDDVFGPDGWVAFRAEDGSTAYGLTSAGLRRVEEMAAELCGPGALAVVDQEVMRQREDWQRV